MVAKAYNEKITGIYFTALAVLTYYFVDQTIAPNIGIPLRQIFVVLFIFSGFICWLVRPNIARTSILLRSSLVMCIPLGVMVTVSLFLWVIHLEDVSAIQNGFYTYFLYMNEVFAVLMAAVFLYMFGEKGIWYNLAAIIVANLLLIASIMAEHGVSAYMNELWILITSFATETGAVIREAEIHELAFCLGIYELYMLLTFRRKPWFILLFALSTFCFVSAFKRIAMAAIAVAAVVGLILKYLARKKNEKTVSKVINIFLVVLFVFAFAYVFAVKNGLFSELEALGVDVKGRAELYEFVDEMYEFSPVFLGHGMGFVYYEFNENISTYTAALHNDILEMYIDLGFWGFLLWLLSVFVLRLRYFGRQGGRTNKALVFAVMLYMFVIFSTDNTLTFQMVYLVTALVIMGNGFDEKVEKEEVRLFLTPSEKGL